MNRFFFLLGVLFLGACSVLPESAPTMPTPTLTTMPGHSNNVWDVAWSPDGTKLAHNALLTGGIHIWDVQTCTRKQHLWQPMKSYVSSPYSLAWSPDGITLAVGTYDGPVLLWDAQKEQVTNTMTVHDRAVQNVAWSPDGTKFATGSVGGTIIIWSAETGQPIHTMAGYPSVRPEDGPQPEPPANPSGYTDGPTSIAWSPDGRILATSGFVSSKTAEHIEAVRLWDVETGQLISVFE
jgi:WD40 repeat protein